MLAEFRQGIHRGNPRGPVEQLEDICLSERHWLPGRLQATQSAQCVAEDYFMSEMDIPALTVVGVEGLFGSIALFGAILPLAQVI